jgi:ribosomal protein L29
MSTLNALEEKSIDEMEIEQLKERRREMLSEYSRMRVSLDVIGEPLEHAKMRQQMMILSQRIKWVSAALFRKTGNPVYNS